MEPFYVLVLLATETVPIFDGIGFITGLWVGCLQVWP